MRRSLAPAFLAVALSLPLWAAEDSKDPQAGHSMHGEAFDDGPRQFATRISGTGGVHLEVTVKSTEGQEFFDQGLGQLHGFWYYEAERSFRQVAWIDPDCAMAYWGMAMANINNQKRATQFIQEAVKRRAKASPREQRWIDAWANYYNEKAGDEKDRREKLVRALEELIYEYPDEIEAKALLVFQLWDNAQHDIRLTSRLSVDALARQVLAENPMHPGAHHYLIHLWNFNGGDKRAIADAAQSGQSAPGIAHMWHMGGHTFSELKRYADAAWQQEASARVDHAYIESARILPEQIHNYAHNNDWLVKNLTYVGRIHDAIDLAKNLIELPKLGPGNEKAWQMGRERLLDTLVDFELWDELVRLESTMYLDRDEDPAREVERLRALGVAFIATGNAARGQEKLDQLNKLLADKRAERINAGDKAASDAEKAGKPEGQVATAMTAALRGFAGQIKDLEKAIAEVRLYQALAAGNKDEAKKLLDQAKLASSVRIARIYEQLGNLDKAIDLARDKVKADVGQVLPQAVLVNLLWQKGNRDEALKAFGVLREKAAQIDLDIPIFAQLAPVAKEAKLGADWRPALTVPPDAGKHPNLANLGPFRWHPYQAPAFSLETQKHDLVSLAKFRGKPVLVVFYLGAGCPHCIEQLNALAPAAKDFNDAGIDIVAVSTDSVEGLHETFEKAKDANGFPFPIVSNHDLNAFRAFRAYDDFEKTALHGTFLIDGNGLVRWQNISYQPFADMPWLLKESKRLLAVPIPPQGATAFAPTGQ